MRPKDVQFQIYRNYESKEITYSSDQIGERGENVQVNSSPFINKISFVPDKDNDNIGTPFSTYFLDPFTSVQE